MTISDFDLRPVETQWLIGIIDDYLETMEAQMEQVEHLRKANLDASCSRESREDYEEYWMLKQLHDDLFEEGLIPALRYSFVVLLHILVETRMRAFCLDLQKERNLPPIALTDFKGSPTEQIKLFLTKLVGITPQQLPEWQHLMTLQKVRDCIVHAYGAVAQSRDEEFLRKLPQQGIGIQINVEGNLSIQKNFCKDQIKNISQFFDSLFKMAGWKPSEGLGSPT